MEPLTPPSPRKSGAREKRYRVITRSIRTCQLPRAPRGPNHVAHEVEHAIGFRRPVRRTAEPDDHQPFGRHDDHILPDRTLGEIGIARPAAFGAVARAKAVAEIRPEA